MVAPRCPARKLQASTSEVYGDPTIDPQTEDYLGNVYPVGVRACCDEGKCCAETLFGDSKQIRSFYFVDDMIDGLVRLINAPGSVTGPVNLGNYAKSTILSLTNKIISLSGSSSTISFGPLPVNDPRQRQPDIKLAGSLLDWYPATDIDAGFCKTISYISDMQVSASI